MKKKELMITQDGSHSFFVPELGESYHSSHGAIQESQKVFIDSGLKYFINQKYAVQKENLKKEIHVFEMGFGSGLNALLTWNYTQSNNIILDYETIELYPISIEEASEINFPDILKIRRDDFLALHNCDWEKYAEISTNFRLLKKRQNIIEYVPEKEGKAFDLVYYDAFSPQVQPDLWKTSIFRKLFKLMNPGGILTSYSVRGDFRRSLQEAGFKVEKIPGPPGKRHITRATKLI